ncbi:SpoIIE family protein phosphatase [Streptomyces genisteinicus]|uniref:SpoIIE family protein phosphatase n=1 Tax=Streptomyces genisteinicus TaxID=2768068 RepID=A0A7H0HML3_9ACTN|nr:SpoIIE family protein phosphatase [Streptomyces genisteinicus]QNP61779.1 SpoIIE family protein phosphatase [Streptomyces genisteinicus]
MDEEMSGRPGRDEDGRTDLARLILDQLPVAVAYFDRSARLVRANPAALDAVGKRLDELVGLRPGEVAPGVMLSGAEGLEAAIEQAMRSGETRTYETRLRIGGARERVLTAVLSPVTGPRGEVLGCSVATLDTTEQHRARERLTVLDQASMRIGSRLDVITTAVELAEMATESLADFVAVDLLAPVLAGDEPRAPAPGSTIVFHRAAQHSVLDGAPESVVPVGTSHTFDRESAVGRALVRGEATRHAVDEESLRLWDVIDPDRARSIREYRVHSTMVAPLAARGITLGMATFLRHRTPEPFDDDDLLLAGELAARAAVAVDNARRYTREHATALALQRSLLPRRTARQQAVEVASRYLPNTTGAGIGGDWFDVIALSGARVALVVGDVVGHGVQASATMGRLRTAVRTLADVDLAPDELLTQLDDLVIKLDREEAVDPGGSSVAGATCLYAVYDPVSGSCSMARAGHPEPVLVRPDGTASHVTLPAGPPLGVGGLPFEATEFEVPERSILALYTDGLIETPGRDIDAALGVLRETLARPSGSLEDTCDAVMAALLPERPDDDIALLLARAGRLGAGHHASWELPADPSVVATARRHVAAQLEEWGLDDAVFTTELVVSELVTNAIRYGGAPIRLRLIRDTALICEVSDGSSTAPHLRRARIFDEGGRGLLLVASLTECWGTRYGPTGKTIWAEQALPGT